MRVKLKFATCPECGSKVRLLPASAPDTLRYMKHRGKSGFLCRGPEFHIPSTNPAPWVKRP